MRIVTNKSNWTGEEIIVDVNVQKKTFSIKDHDFKIVLVEDHSKEKTFPMKIYALHYNDENYNEEYPIGIITEMLPDKYRKITRYEAFHGMVSENSLSRTGNNIYEAAIKLICNVI